MRFVLLCVLFVTPAVTMAADRASSVAGQTSTPADVKFDFVRWPFPLYKEVAGRLRELAKQYPKLAQVQTIGKSGEDRDLLVMEITNHDTGPGESKPAIWMDANLHPDEVQGRPILMYFIERLLASYGHDPDATELVNTRTFYIMPMFNPDAGERALTAEPKWPGYKASEHEGKDLDGDGYITQMRVKDPNGEWYASPIDSRVMLKLRERGRGIWSYIPTTHGDDLVFNVGEPNIGWQSTGKEPEPFQDPLAPPDKRYRLYIEGVEAKSDQDTGLYERPRDQLGEREPADFNRNWSAEWHAEDPGAGPFPFSLPEVFAAARFITEHRNIFFDYSIHTGGGGQSYMVRPPMNHPYEYIPSEDNNFYTRLAGIWAASSGGAIMESNYYSYVFNCCQYGETMHGFENDWAYLQQGIYSLTPEIGVEGKDYDGDGYVTEYEKLRWNDEEAGGKYFAAWKPYKHPVLGDVEIGGWRNDPPAPARLRSEAQAEYQFLLHIARLSPLLRIKDLKADKMDSGQYRVVATLQNEGFLSTYVTRKALETRRDYPVVAKIEVLGGELVKGKQLQQVGHIFGRFAYYGRWTAGADESIRTMEWVVKATGAGPMKASVAAWSPKAGRDERTVTIDTSR